MKELETHLKLNQNERIELNVKKKQEVEYILEGTIKPKVGHKLWELNEETGEILEAKYINNTIGLLNNTKITPSKLKVNPDCIYIPALNAENAKKKYLKNNTQSFYYTKKPLFNLNDIP